MEESRLFWSEVRATTRDGETPCNIWGARPPARSPPGARPGVTPTAARPERFRRRCRSLRKSVRDIFASPAFTVY